MYQPNKQRYVKCKSNGGRVRAGSWVSQIILSSKGGNKGEAGDHKGPHSTQRLPRSYASYDARYNVPLHRGETSPFFG